MQIGHALKMNYRKHPLYWVFYAMRSRCLNKNDSGYKNYGGRGIKIHQKWLDDPRRFVDWGISHGYKKGLDIDRANNNKGYSPSNCRFVTRWENTRNTRRNVYITAFNETKCLWDWIRDSRCKLNYRTVYQRLEKGIDHANALFAPKLRAGRCG